MSLTAATHTIREGAFGNGTHLSCRACGAKSPLGPFYACMECFGPLEVGYEYPTITREQIEAGPKNIWRYQPLLPVPVDVASFPNTEPGYTRLVDAQNLARELGLRKLWVKDDSGNPTHSFKDRVVASALSATRELGMKVFACPSTGNLANAVAAAAARAGIRSVVFIPHDLERPKVITTAVYGGTLVAVEGNYDDVNKLASEIAGEEEGWAFVNVNVRPYYSEGSKTLAFEIAEQLGWRIPQQVVIPVASGSQLTKIDKGFTELGKLGLVDATDYKVYGAQATGCSPVAQAFRDGHDVVKPVKPGHHREVAGDRQPGRRTVRARRRPPYRRSDRGRQRRGSRRGHPVAGPDRGHLRRDRGRGDGRDAEEADRDRAARPRGRDGDHQLRRRAEDARRRGRPGRPQGDHPRVVRRLREGRPAVSVSVRVPTILRPYTQGVSEVSAEGATLIEVLDSLDGSYPGIKGRVLDDSGELRRFVNVYVDDDDVRFADGLQTVDQGRRPGLDHPGGRRRLILLRSGRGSSGIGR